MLSNVKITQTEEKYKPNYLGVIAKAGIDGAMAGFMAQDSGSGKTGMEKGEYGADKNGNLLGSSVVVK